MIIDRIELAPYRLVMMFEGAFWHYHVSKWAYLTFLSAKESKNGRGEENKD